MGGWPARVGREEPGSCRRALGPVAPSPIRYARRQDSVYSPSRQLSGPAPLSAPRETGGRNCHARAGDRWQFLHRGSRQIAANRRISEWHAACSHWCSPAVPEWTPQRGHQGGRREYLHRNRGSASGGHTRRLQSPATTGASSAASRPDARPIGSGRHGRRGAGATRRSTRTTSWPSRARWRPQPARPRPVSMRCSPETPRGRTRPYPPTRGCACLRASMRSAQGSC